MSEMSVALIACDNGLGHIRRMIALAGAMQAKGASPTIFAPKERVQKICQTVGLPCPKLKDFVIETSIRKYASDTIDDWPQRLPNLDGFDAVVSDNLIEILEIRPDAWLSGSFLWPFAATNLAPVQKDYAEALLRKHMPRMVSTALFASDYLDSMTQLSRVGLFELVPAVAQSDRDDLLLSCGTGGEAYDELKALLSRISKSDQPKCRTIFIEPDLYSTGLPDWIKPATFDQMMYGSIKSALVRPGIGTLTDTILAGVRPFCFYEQGNAEMAFNAQRVEAEGLGIDSGSALKGWEQLNSSLYAEGQFSQQPYKLAELNKNGAAAAADLILGQWS